MSNSILENDDFYYDENGNMVFTAKYHKKRGFCCKSGCRHCPFGFGSQIDSEMPVELIQANNDEEDELARLQALAEEYEDEF